MKADAGLRRDVYEGNGRLALRNWRRRFLHSVRAAVSFACALISLRRRLLSEKQFVTNQRRGVNEHAEDQQCSVNTFHNLIINLFCAEKFIRHVYPKVNRAVNSSAKLLRLRRENPIRFFQRFLRPHVVPDARHTPSIERRAFVHPLDEASRLIRVVSLRHILLYER